MVIMLTYLLTSTRNFICSFKSLSSMPALVLILKGIFITHESLFMISNVCFLSFNNALPHQVFMTFLAGHHIFNSIPEKINFGFWILDFGLLRYLVCMSSKHFITIASLPQKICAITGDCFLSVRRCLITPSGLIMYPSAFMNSVRRISSYFFFSPYFSKISFVI